MDNINIIDIPTTRYSDFRRWDLNLLVAFDALIHEQGHLSRAAARLHLGQPAMSHALGRLRELLHDPLFVRNGAHLVPTARALELAPAVAALLQDAHALLSADDRFDPAHAQLTLRIAFPEHFELLWLPSLMAHLCRAAPGIRLQSVPLRRDQLLDELDNDHIDLIIAGSAVALRRWHQRQWLLDAHFIYLYNPALVDLPRPASLADLAGCPFVTSDYLAVDAGEADHVFHAAGLRRAKALTCSGLAAIVRVVSQAPLVAILPDIVTHFYTPPPELAIVPFAPDSLSMPIHQVWHSRFDRHPAHVYVRDEIRRITERIRENFIAASPIDGKPRDDSHGGMQDR